MAPLHEHFRDKVGENHRRVGSGSPAEGARLATQGTSREEGGPPRTTERQRIGTAAGVSEDKPPPDSLQALLSTRSFLRPQRRRRRRYSRAPKERKQPLSFHVRIFITLPLSLFIYLLIASTSTTTTLSLSLSLPHRDTTTIITIRSDQMWISILSSLSGLCGGPNMSGVSRHQVKMGM